MLLAYELMLIMDYVSLPHYFKKYFFVTLNFFLETCNTYSLFNKQVFLPSTETFLTFPYFQYQNFLKTFIANFLSSNVLRKHIIVKPQSTT